MTDAAADSRLLGREIVARVERLPYCQWHLHMRLIICSAWFFDSFDSLAIVSALPALIGLWKLKPHEIGELIAIGFAGQLIGALAAGWIAERWGRVNTMLATLLLFSLASLACAFARSYEVLYWIRFVQGIGLGGEVPIMAAYVNEFARAERRGRFSLSIQILFAIGIAICALVGVWVVPNLGWQWMFIIGVLPALIVIPLRFMLPESPRWLASRGRFMEADRALKRIEAIARREGHVLPPIPTDLPAAIEAKPRIGDLFNGIYARRTITLWIMWVCTYVITYGLTAWAPSLFRFVFKLPVETSLLYGFVLNVAGLIGAFVAVGIIDWIGRKRMYLIAFGGAAVLLLAFGVCGTVAPGLIFGASQRPSALAVLICICVSFPFVSLLALSLATYTAENYPNQLRAQGGGVASAWQRLASMGGPIMVGFILPVWGLTSVFTAFGIFAFVGFIVTVLFAIETRGLVLERLSPVLGRGRDPGRA